MVGFIKEKMPPVTLKEIYVVDTDTLTRERPVGVSGLLRCKNCEDFLEMSIDSCIDGLDELIAVYHDCTDRTPQILRQKAAQYPDKSGSLSIGLLYIRSIWMKRSWRRQSCCRPTLSIRWQAIATMHCRKQAIGTQ